MVRMFNRMSTLRVDNLRGETADGKNRYVVQVVQGTTSTQTSHSSTTYDNPTSGSTLNKPNLHHSTLSDKQTTGGPSSTPYDDPTSGSTRNKSNPRHSTSSYNTDTRESQLNLIWQPNIREHSQQAIFSSLNQSMLTQQQGVLWYNNQQISTMHDNSVTRENCNT